MKYPVADNGDPLIYHRLTGLGRASRNFGGIEAVQALIEREFVLTPYDERGAGDEPGEMFGIDAIDIVAGDGGAVFLTPFKPYGQYVPGKPGLTRGPGVAFRLSDLLALGDVSVRPMDFQIGYLQITDQEDIKGAMIGMKEAGVEVYDQVHEMEPLSDAFRLVRSAEIYNAQDALAYLKYTIRLPIKTPSRAVLHEQAEKAAGRASDFVYEYSSYAQEHAEEEGEEYWTPVVDDITHAIVAATLHMFEAWEGVIPDPEVLFWGLLPLSKAAIVFDNERIVRNRYAPSSVASGLGEAWPAVRAR